MGVFSFCIPKILTNLVLKGADGLMKKKHTYKKGAPLAPCPPTHYVSNPSGGGVAYKDPPPP